MRSNAISLFIFGSIADCHSFGLIYMNIIRRVTERVFLRGGGPGLDKLGFLVFTRRFLTD